MTMTMKIITIQKVKVQLITITIMIVIVIIIIMAIRALVLALALALVATALLLLLVVLVLLLKDMGMVFLKTLLHPTVRRHLLILLVPVLYLRTTFRKLELVLAVPPLPVMPLLHYLFQLPKGYSKIKYWNQKNIQTVRMNLFTRIQINNLERRHLRLMTRPQPTTTTSTSSTPAPRRLLMHHH